MTPMTFETVDLLERIEEHEHQRAVAFYRFEVAMQKRRQWDLDAWLCWAAATLWLVLLMTRGLLGAVPCFLLGLVCSGVAREKERVALECLYRAGKAMGAQVAIAEVLASQQPWNLEVARCAFRCVVRDRDSGEGLERGNGSWTPWRSRQDDGNVAKGRCGGGNG